MALNFSLSSDEELENRNPSPMKKSSSSSSSSSNSDSDTGIPKAKKKRVTKTFSAIRAQALLKPSALTTVAPSSLFGGGSSIFSTAVTSKFSTVCLKRDEEEISIKEIFKKKPAGRQIKSTTNTKKGATRRKNKASESEVSEVEEYQPQVILLEDEETDVDSDNDGDDYIQQDTSLSLSQTREPTPPPSSSSELDLPRIRLKPKVKKAFRKLAKAQIVHLLNDSTNDPDLSITDIVSPSQENKQLSMKIKSRSGIQRFPIKMTDSFVSIFHEMATHEGVEETQISMYINDRRIKHYDTPALLRLGIADIIG